MARQSVLSSNIESFSYDITSGVLEVEFKNHSVWQYTQVPQELATQLQLAPSFGKFFSANIKHKYPSVKIL